MIGCEEKKDCPICNGLGEVVGYGTCPACKGEKKLTTEQCEQVMEIMNKIRSGSINVNQQQMATCPVCKGAGTNNFNGDVNTCGFCNGVGEVSQESAAQMRHVMQGGHVSDFYPTPSPSPSSPSSNSTSGRLCPACDGSGVCPVCNGSGNNSYYGETPRPCPKCYHTGKCYKCMGNGIIP